ncbi:MAG: hypothetical protein AB1505_34065 [Candidatus Latescibacterota bacterium]
MLLVFCGLIALCVPTIAELVHHYPSLDERLRHARGLVPAPPLADLVQRVQEAEPATRGAEVRPVHVPAREPRTGLAGVYDLVQQGQVAHRLVVLRHDIPCGRCRDILAVALYTVAESALARVLLIEPFETETGAVDAQPFLAQLAGRPAAAHLEVGRNVDGITHATNSSTGLVEGLNEAGAWLQAHRPLAGAAVESEGGAVHGG